MRELKTNKSVGLLMLTLVLCLSRAFAIAACGNYNFAPDQSAKLCPASSWRYLWYLELLLMLHAR